MSLDEDQFTLPKSLEKLEIVPLIPYIKLYDNNCTIKSNPFYNKKLLLYNNKIGDNNNNNNNNSINNNNIANKINLFGPECECDVLIKEKKCNNNNNNNNNTGSNNKSTIIHQIQFKYKNKYDKKILKEPILKYIGKCIHHNHIKHKSLAKVNNNNIYNVNDNKLENINGDVKALLLDCQSLSLKYSLNSNKLHGDLIKMNNMYDLKNKLSSINNFSVTTWTTTTASLTTSSGLTSSTTMSSSLSSSSASSTATTSAATAATAATSSSSCSQQANKMNSSCDVTMDELASYFETFVYIPKKMSVMAEMMYT